MTMSLLNVLKFPESLEISLTSRMTYEKFASEEPRLSPTVPYALTISNNTENTLNHGSEVRSEIRRFCRQTIQDRDSPR